MPAPLPSRFRDIRTATEALCRPLAVEDFVVQSMPDASPAKWHLAHTSWFFEEFVLQAFVPGYAFHDPQYRFLFNSYYQAVGPMHARPQRGLLSRPTVTEVLAYRAHVDEQMSMLLQREAGSEALERVVALGLHHEQQHQELLLTDIKHLFSCNPLLPAYASAPPVPAGAPGSLRFQRFDGGLIEVGIHADERTGASFETFCFDNETPRHRVYLRPYALANRPVTNAEFREFIAAGGYQTAAHWLSDGWARVQREAWCRPLYWTPSLEQEFTLAGLRELHPHAPVCHLSYYEADAFARWAGARLPSEFEWEAAAAPLPARGNFVESGHRHPVPAGQGSPAQMFGDVWEWTQSAYSPYPGFRPLGGALGEYNGKFMVSQLVLRGGSCATPASHIRASYRNFFYPDARWQFSGVRLARDA